MRALIASIVLQLLLVLASATAHAADNNKKCNSLADCSAACDKNDLPSCERLSRAYAEGVWGPVDNGKAAAARKKACDGGNVDGCGEALYDKYQGSTSKEMAGEEQALCDRGSRVACTYLSYANVSEDVRAAALSRVDELGEAACAAGDPAACLAAVPSSYYGQGGDSVHERLRAASMRKKAADAATHACGGEDWIACLEYARAVRNGEGAPSQKRAEDALEKLCDHGSPDACGEAGMSIAHVGASAADDAKGEKLLLRGCDLGSAYSCEVAAERFAEGDHPDAKRAVGLWQKACDLSEVGACERLVSMLADADPAGAAAAAKKGCDAESASSCMWLAEAYAEGKGVAKDPKQSVAMSERVCAKNIDPYYCATYGRALYEGKRIPADHARAAELLRAACETGIADACVPAGLLYENGAGPAKADKAVARKMYEAVCKKDTDYGGYQCGCTYLQRMDKKQKNDVVFPDATCQWVEGKERGGDE
jgi:TPR repeat protein